MTLDHKVELYIPSTKNVNEVLTRAERNRYARIYLEKFARLFGGSSAVEFDGCYIARDNSPVFERIKCVFAYCETLNTAVPELQKLATELRIELSQECVAIVIDGSMTWI